MFDGIRARWAAARNARLAQTLDLDDGEAMLQAGPTDDPAGALFLTDRRIVLHDYDAMRELSVPWERVQRAQHDDRGRQTRLALTLDSPTDEPDELTALVPTEMVPALLAVLQGGRPSA